MTNKEKVLTVYPDRYFNWIVTSHPQHRGAIFVRGEQVSGEFATEAEAWDNAASKLPSAPSPAGETASAPPFYCHDWEAHVHVDTPCQIQCLGCYRTGKTDPAVPEPVSTEGAADDRCEHQWGDTRDDTVQVCKACLARRTVAAPIAPAAVPTRNSVLLADFASFCEKNPELRFWQALRAWSEWPFICVTEDTPFAEPREVLDTFYWEGRRG